MSVPYIVDSQLTAIATAIVVMVKPVLHTGRLGIVSLKSACLVICLSLLQSVWAAEPNSRAILLLFPYQADLPQTVLAQQAIQAELGSVSALTLNWYYEYLDLNRVPGEEYQQQLADLYAAKYRRKPIDLVFVVSERMLDFWLQHRDNVLPDTPVVFYDILPESLTGVQLPEDVTGLTSKLDHARVLKWIQRMRPAIKEIVVVQGVSKADQEFNIPLDTLQMDLGENLSLTDWSHLPFNEIKQRAAHLSPGTIIFYQLMFEDAAGGRYRPIDVLNELVSVAAVPIISKYDQFIGTGTIGGYMYSIEEVAKEAARRGIRILHGEAASNIQITAYQGNRFIFDHPALQRWDIPLSSLPADSIIKNRQCSLWERYRLQLITLSVGIAGLLALVVYLGVVTRRLRIARQELSQFSANLETQVSERTVALSQSNRRLEEEIADRKQVEKALRQSEEKFSKAFHSNQIAMALSTLAEGRYLDVNAEFLRLAERPYDEVIGHTALELHVWTDPRQRDQTMATLKEGGDLHNVELDIRTPSGKMRTVLWSAERVMLRDTDCVLVSAIDITARKQAENALRESEARWQFALEGAGEGVWDWNAQTDTVFFSPQWKAMLGFEPHEIGNSLAEWENRVHPEDLEQVHAAIQAHFDGKTPIYISEHRVRCKDGSYKWMLDRGKAVNWAPDGKPLRVIGTHSDITDRKQSEEALRKSTTLLNDSQKITKIGGWEYNLATGQTFWTDEVFRIHDLPVDKFSDSLQQKIADSIVCYLPEDRPVVLECFRQAAEEGRPYDREFRFKTYEGNLKWIRTMGRPLFEDGQIVRVLGTLMDISEQKHTESLLQQAKEDALKAKERALEEQRTAEAAQRAAEAARRAAEAANRAKSEFLATMSHEIRTPMNAILGFAELLDELITAPKHRNYLDSIRSSGKMLLTLINDILDLSKLEAGKMTLQLEPVRLCRLIEEIRQIFSLRASQKLLDLRIECDRDLPEILLLDEVRLRQVLFNLLGNAVKFTEKGAVTLTAKAQGDLNDDIVELIIVVEDTGIGIPPEEHQQIFEAFQQRAGQRMQQFGGTGLGLAISKRLIDMMGGTITVQSEAGQGSAFELRLPQVPIAAVDSIHTGMQPPPVDVSGLQAMILMADDIASNRQLLTASFEGTNITVITAENGKEALDMARMHHPDLILMDLKMPVMNGYEAFRQLQKDPELCQIPVVAITASSLKSDIEATEFAGYLRKPVSKVTLFQEICRVLRYQPPHSQNVDVSAPLPQEILPEARSMLPKALTQLEHDILPQWEQLQIIQPISAVKQFGQDVQSLGACAHLDILQEYGQKLLLAIDYFDIDAMRTTLSEFPTLLAALRAGRNGRDA